MDELIEEVSGKLGCKVERFPHYVPLGLPPGAKRNESLVRASHSGQVYKQTHSMEKTIFILSGQVDSRQ